MAASGPGVLLSDIFIRGLLDFSLEMLRARKVARHEKQVADLLETVLFQWLIRFF